MLSSICRLKTIPNPSKLTLKQLHDHGVAVDAHLELLACKAKGGVQDWDEWINRKNRQTFVTHFLAHETLVDLFAGTSKELENPGTGTSQRAIGDLLRGICDRSNATRAGMKFSDEILGSMFEHHLRSSYCPRDVYGDENTKCRDPILHNWVEQSHCRAALLFPRECYSERKAVFSPRRMKDVLLDVHPIDKLVLHKSIEWALVHVILAIVPDVDIQPVHETTITFNYGYKAELREERTQILKDWLASNVKEYNIDVFERTKTMASTPQTINDGGSVLPVN
ncbi:hypothetical protein CSIM01_06664 [Colletotrichum simmondsii]|uniref:Uncharacterized protein n=1 Tax=Colletotrichum simmondsii TaxID=703756 RepID=A0A135SUK8_9PEZI|nr:hypothetical protein CSIM01_06664 [Colletotrichum simmondsii]